MREGGAKTIAISSAVLLTENLIRLIAVVLVSFWMARQLGPGQFGILNFASAFMAILLAVAAMGLDTPVILRLTHASRPGALLGTALLIRGIASLVVFALGLLIALLLKQGDHLSLQATWIVSLCILAYTFNTLDFWFKAHTASAAPALARTAASLLGIGAKVAFLLMGLGVVALAWTITLEAVLAGIGLVLAYLWSTKNSPQDKLSLDPSEIRPLLKESLPYLWSSVAVLLYMKVDVVMLGYLSSKQETGIYSLAQKLSEVLYMVPVVLIDSAYPTLARKFLAAQSDQASHGQMLFDLAVGGSLVAVALAMLLVGPAITLVFGSEYTASIDIFRLHAWSCVAIALNTARHRWLATVGLQRHAPTVTLIGLVLNLAMNVVLIPAMGAMGAAIATVVSYFVSGYFTSYLIPPLREIGQMQTRSLWPWLRLAAHGTAWRAR